MDADGQLRWRVPAEEAGSRIDRLLGRLLAPDYSRSYLSALISEGTITLDGQRVRPSYRVEEGVLLAGALGQAAGSLPGPEDLPIPIVHEDEALIIVSKPVDLIIHPGGATKTGTLVNGLLHRYPELAVVGRADRPGIVHRLDRDTSGVMVVARTNEAAQSLVRQFKAKTVQKEYAALVWGVPPFDSDWIDLPIGPRRNKPHLRQVVREGGQPASTFYEVRERLGVASHLAAYPRTGRTHQIRVHLDHIGFPILGDGQYGGQKRVQYERWCTAREKAGQAAPALSRQALHARKLTFEHPLSGEQVTFEAPLPEDMVRALELLRTIDE